MVESQANPLAKVVAFCALAELVIGLLLLAVPNLIVSLLFAPPPSASLVPVARVAGIALIALGLACWPSRHHVAAATFRALLSYNALVAAYLACLTVGSEMKGLLLWPVVGLHALMSVLLVYFRTTNERAQ